MAAQKHTIKKFSLQLLTESNEQSHALQRRFIQVVNERLARGMDEVLSGYFPEDEIVRINKIEIDLGSISNENIESEFAAKYMEGFASKIKLMPVKKDEAGENEVTIVDSDENVLEQFFYFLSSGKLTWVAHGINFAEWVVKIVEAIKRNKDSFKKKFSVLVTKNPRVVERLVLQFENEFVGELIGLYYPQARKEYETLAMLLKAPLLPGDNLSTGKKLLVKLLSLLLANEVSIEKEVQELFNQPAMESLRRTDEKKYMIVWQSILSVIEESGIVFNETRLINDGLEKPIKEHAVTAAKTETVIKNEEREADDTSIYINNAGIVILHPFLQNLFQATSLMEAENFKNEISRQKAVHLLQYMANGEKEVPEYIMHLNKTLCGIAGEEHIDRFIKLEEIEIKEADELLEAVINHWSILKNTSVQALQETFFKRNGKLSFSKTGEQWKLQVERKSVDILLDKIPWGISYIQLPWMKYALVTEW